VPEFQLVPKIEMALSVDLQRELKSPALLHSDQAPIRKGTQTGNVEPPGIWKEPRLGTS